MNQKLKILLRPYWHFLIYFLAKLLRNLPLSSEIIGPPKRCYQSTNDWLAQKPSEGEEFQGSLKTIYPSHEVHFSNPLTVTQDINKLEFCQSLSSQFASAFVAVIPKGRVWGYDSCIISPDDGVIADISQEFSKPEQIKFIPSEFQHSIFRQFKLSNLSKIEGSLAVLSTAGQSNYYHWMFDILPRIHLLRCSNIPLANIDKFLVNEIRYEFQKETLKILGIPLTKVIETKKSLPLHIKADRLIVPSINTFAHPHWTCSFLRQEFLNNNLRTYNSYPKLIYISRQKARYRKVINEEKVVDFLDIFGFKKITLESMSISEQALLFAAAKIIIAPHGAGLSNIVFCNSGTKIIEFLSPNFLSGVFWNLSNQVDLKYHCLVGEHHNFTKHKDPKMEDILVNIDSLVQTIIVANTPTV